MFDAVLTGANADDSGDWRPGLRAGREIEDVLGGELRHSVKQPLSEHMPFTESIHKEETS